MHFRAYDLESEAEVICSAATVAVAVRITGQRNADSATLPREAAPDSAAPIAKVPITAATGHCLTVTVSVLHFGTVRRFPRPRQHIIMIKSPIYQIHQYITNTSPIYYNF